LNSDIGLKIQVFGMAQKDSPANVGTKQMEQRRLSQEGFR
jgi:hypothetical protein